MSWFLSFSMLALADKRNVCRGVVGGHFGGKEGGACGSCKMPTGSHYTCVLSGSFRAPKNFLPLNGAFGKRGVHWNHKQTQEESKNQRGGGGWKKERRTWVDWGIRENHDRRHRAAAEEEEVQSKDNEEQSGHLHHVWRQLSETEGSKRQNQSLCGDSDNCISYDHK